MGELERPRGIYPILYAFFDREGRLDRAAMRRQVEPVSRAARTGSRHSGLRPR